MRRYQPPRPCQRHSTLAAQSAAAGSKVFNPDISVLGNFAGAAGKNPFSEEPSLSLTEVETAFQAVVDPYARADFFLSAGPEGLEVEEGYITFTALPAGVLLKAGKMREQFGKVNTMHTHILPWVDRPLVSRNLFGGDEGVADAGLSVSKLIPNGFMFIDAIGEVYRGDSDVFRSERPLGPELPRPDSRLPRPDRGHQPRYRRVVCPRAERDGPGFQHASASASTSRSAIVRCRRAIYRQFVGRTEIIWSRQNVAGGWPAERLGVLCERRLPVRPALVRRCARRSIGPRRSTATCTIRADRSHLTFRPSEFSLVRGQYRRTNYADGTDANEFLFQINFAIGAHGAHPF